MPIGRYTCSVRGCAQAIQEISLRKREGYREALEKQIVRGKLLISLYDQIIIQKTNSIISMKWFHIVRDDITMLKTILNNIRGG